MTSPEPQTPPRARPASYARPAIYFLLLLALGGAAYAYGVLHGGYHFAAVQDGVLYRSGNKDLRQFTAGLERGHIRTIVPLIDDNELNDPAKPQFNQELEYAARHGIDVLRIPVRLGGWPTSDDVRQFLQIVSDPKDRPVLVHCAQGVRRTGMFVAAYQESVLGYDKARAKAAIQSFGHSQSTIAAVEKFIDLYDPRARTIDASGLATGEEK